MMSNSESDLGRLEGVTALIEDWHAKVSFLGVSMHMCSVKYIIYRQYGCVCTPHHLEWIVVHCSSSETC